MEEAAIMMVTYNRLELTKRTLQSIHKDPGFPYRLVIVDNGSTDGTQEFLVRLAAGQEPPPFYDVRIKLNKENKGIAIGRNQALKMADEFGPSWYCTIDNDVEMPDGWLRECIDIIKANPRYGMIGVNMEGKQYPVVNENNKTFQNKPQGNLGTACMVFPKSVHGMLGFFNTEYGPYGEEDADFGMRARVVGYKLGYIKENGNHFGVGELDQGEYREYKTACHKKNLAKFNENCRAYYGGMKAPHIAYKE